MNRFKALWCPLNPQLVVYCRELWLCADQVEFIAVFIAAWVGTGVAAALLTFLQPHFCLYLFCVFVCYPPCCYQTLPCPSDAALLSNTVTTLCSNDSSKLPSTQQLLCSSFAAASASCLFMRARLWGAQTLEHLTQLSHFAHLPLFSRGSTF